MSTIGTGLNAAVAKFGFAKQADLTSILPAIVLPALGVYAGSQLHDRLGMKMDAGKLFGGIAGGIAGQMAKEKLQQRQVQNQMPAGAPYDIDPTSLDIPPWALAGAQFMQGAKVASGGVAGTLGPDLMGSAYPMIQGIQRGDSTKEVGMSVLGQGAGIVGGGLAGHGIGHLINHLAGKEVNVPGLGMPLSTLLMGLGATVGNYHGDRLTTPLRHLGK